MSEPEVDWGVVAQRAAEKRLAALWELIDECDEDTAMRIELSLDPPLDAPYCGCHTCDVRETLVAAWPILQAAARAEVAGGH